MSDSVATFIYILQDGQIVSFIEYNVVTKERTLIMIT